MDTQLAQWYEILKWRIQSNWWRGEFHFEARALRISRRWSTRWKAAAKKWYITKPLRGAQKQIIEELQTENDQLRQRLRDVTTAGDALGRRG